MSVGAPSPLGTLLVQRLDAVLGTTLSQQANIVSGARPDAVTQPGSPERPDPARSETQRQPREAVDRAAAHAEQQGRNAVDRSRLDARTAALLLARNTPNTSTTPSAPTTLGQAAKTILALLANYPDQSATVQGRQPLLALNAKLGAKAGVLLPPTAGRDGGEGQGRTATAGSSGGAASTPTAAGTSQAGTPAQGSASPSTGSSPTGTSAASGPGSTLIQPNALVATQLAQSLAQTLQTSGMFYESHLSNLAFGKQTIASLLQEPQAQARRASNPQGGPSTGAAAPAPNTGLPDASAARPTSDPAPQNTQASRGPDAIQSPTSSTASAANPVPGLEPQTHTLVRQQLEILANQSFAWRGDAWPDAPMEWEVNRRDADTDPDGPQTEHWATRISIKLPQLGEVQARLTLVDQQLVMQLVAPDSADQLSGQAETLRSRYAAQGLQLSQLSIHAVDASSSSWPAAPTDRSDDSGQAPA